MISASTVGSANTKKTIVHSEHGTLILTTV